MCLLLLIAFLYHYLSAYWVQLLAGPIIFQYFYLFLCIQLDLNLQPLPPWRSLFLQPVLPQPWRSEVPVVYTPPKVSYVYPAAMGIFLSRCILLSHWFYNMRLKILNFTWDTWTLYTSKLMSPPHIWDIRLHDIYNHPTPLPKWQRKRPSNPDRHRLLAVLGLLSRSLTEAQPFALCSDVSFRRDLRSYRGRLGELQTTTLKSKDLSVLQSHLRSSGLLFQELTSNSPHAFTCIVDTGCSHSATNSFTDVDPTTIRELTEPINLGGIAGGLLIKYVGRANWETLDDNGNVVSFHEEVLIHPDLPDRLLSPQAFLRGQNNPRGNTQDHFQVFHDRAEWHHNGAKLLTMDYDSSFLPRLILFSKGATIPTLKAFTASVLQDSNRNLTSLQKLWLRWHIKLGHLSFSHVQKLGIGGWLDQFALGLQRSKVLDHPHCSACKFGKQTRRPDSTTTTVKNHTGTLSVNQLSPGGRIFCDHLVSRVRGRLFHTAGREPEGDQYCGAMIFYDAASGLIHVEPQVTLNATDTILAKDSFERMALQSGVTIDSYHTDNGVFKNQRFVQEIHTNVQSIRFSGVGAHWQNGMAEGAIRIIVSRARTLMLHAVWHWPEMEDASLWPMAMAHAVHIYNHTPNELTGIAPIETFSGSLSDGQALRNLHTWGCPTYVLEPRLTEAGGKIPKWQPRSRRAQFMGMSPVHAESVGLVRNLTTGYISPQYHLVYDDWFETVHSPHDVEPIQWNDMCIFNRFEVDLEDHVPAPLLADEWLTPEEIAANRVHRRTQQLRQGRRLYQDHNNRTYRDDLNYQPPEAPPPPPREPPREPVAVDTREPPPREPLPAPAPPPSPRELPPPSPRERHPLALPREMPPQPLWTRTPTDAPVIRAPDALIAPPNVAPPSTTARRNPGRATRNQPPPAVRFSQTMDPSKRTYGAVWKDRPSSLLAMILDRTCGLTPQTVVAMQAQVLGFDPKTGLQELLPPGFVQSPFAMKGKISRDPDIPSLKESLNGPHAEHFWKAMDAEIASLEGKDTWKVVDRSAMPTGTQAVPGTWAQRIKRLPNGELNKFKSRWCCRGDLQDYEGTPYSPLVGWPTVRTGLLLAAAHGWKSRQVDFTLAFCQSPQPIDQPLYMELPQYYRPSGYEGQDVVLQLQKSIYGQVDSPKLFFEHLSKGMRELGFVPSTSDPCLFIHSQHKLMVLNYCDDQIWLSPDDSLIEDYVSKLSGLGYDLTLEPKGDIFGFLGINFTQNGTEIELTQTGLIDKIIKYTGMTKASSQLTPATPEPLGSDKDGEPFQEEWNYSAAVGMLLYVSSNTRPDIQFAVHQVARFSHGPKKSHGAAIKRIVRYLIDTSQKGITFQPNLEQGLDCWVDADFAGLYGYEDEQDPVSVKSRTGFVLTLFGCPVLWSSKLQTDITLSSTAAEYVAFSMAMRELLPLRRLLEELSSKMDLPVIKQSLVRSTVFEDNMGCLSLVTLPKMSPRNKYLALKYHFFREHIGEAKGIVARYIPTLQQRADIFTKGLPPTQFAVIRKLLLGW
jgi:Reverse transcriptase (RNA-dependent DNA polymerase)